MPKLTRSVEAVDGVRDQILDIAFKIIEENGYEGLSMAKIGSKMKMTAANLYNYYGNKDELLIAIHKKAYAMMYDKLSYAVSTADTPFEKYKGLTRAFVEFGTYNINIYDVMFNRPVRQHSDYIGTPQEELSFDEFRNSLKAFFLTIKVIRDYLDTRPDVQPVDPKLLAIQCFSLLHGAISLHNSGVLYQISDDPDIAMQTIMDSVTRLITG
ncbi:MAG: TetR/AcrR family transcriptional regulator [Smithellaceae bacterium]